MNRVLPFGQSVEIGIDSAYRTILCKFFFTNPAHIPQGVEEKDRKTNAEMDRQHTKAAYQAGHGYLAQVGRIREGRVDTGNHFIDNVHNVQPGFLTKGLANVGYHATSCHWFFKSGEGKSSDKYVVVVELTLNGDNDATALPEAGLNQRRALANTCWQWCHGYANPDGTITLNFGGREPEQTAKNAVVVRNRHLTAARIESLVAEEDE